MVDKKISRQFYEQKLEQYEKQIEDIIQAKEKHARADIDYLKLGASIFELSQRGSELYEKRMSVNEKREVLSLVFSNVKLNGEKLVPTFQNGFEVVAKRAEDGNWLGVVDDFRTFDWVERIRFPSTILHMSTQLLVTV
jgi:hypothetical protein